MNNEELIKKLDAQGKLLEQVYISVEKTRKYFLWTLVATLIAFVLPLILAIIVLPILMSSYTELLSGVGLGL